MDGKKANIAEKMTEENTKWMERMNKVKIESIDEKRKVLIQRLDNAVDILKGLVIKSEADLDYIKKPLDDLESSLKYIPNGQLFNDVIPAELKDCIFNYLCDSNAFIATAVCQEWKKTLEKRFKGKEVIIGKCCKCEDNVCVEVEAVDMLKAAAEVRELDFHLVVLSPVIEVDSKIVTDGLINVSRFTIQELSIDRTMSDDQLKHLFESLERGDKIMEEVKLEFLTLNVLNQQRLANCLVNKVKRVTIEHSYDANLIVELFLRKILEDPTDVKLIQLTLLGEFDCFNKDSENLSPTGLADALCSIENVKLSGYIPLASETVERIFENILIRPVKIKTLIIELDDLDEDEELREGVDFYVFRHFIVPRDLITLLNKMTYLQLEGIFTPELLDAGRSVPDVQIREIHNGFCHSVTKDSNGLL